MALLCSEARADTPIVIGLDADFSGPAKGGANALRIGAETAVAEINNNGGIKGRPLKLVTSDHRAIPRRGVENFKRLVQEEGAVTVLTGVHSQVALAQVPIAQDLRTPLISPWAAATSFVSNGYSENFAFRVSVRDEFAAAFLVAEAHKRGFRSFGLILENSKWGQSNDAGIRAAVSSARLGTIVETAWFPFGGSNLGQYVDNVLAAEPEAIFLVANPREGAEIIKEISKRAISDRPAVFSHWGIVAGDAFAVSDGQIASEKIWILQTFSFFDPWAQDIADHFLKLTCETHGICVPENVASHTGLSHAYDAVHAIAKALVSANSLDGSTIRDALENLEPFDGLVRRYDPIFSPDRHEALNRQDFRLVRFAEDGTMKPDSLGH